MDERRLQLEGGLPAAALTGCLACIRLAASLGQLAHRLLVGVRRQQCLLPGHNGA